MYKIFFVSLGCDKNLVDSEVMLGIIDRAGYIITYDENKADAIIINTCGFILDAAEEGIDNILSLAAQKRDGCCKALIVTGCMAQRYKEQIFTEMPEVDAVVGVGEYEKIAEVLAETLGGAQGVTRVGDASDTAALTEQNALNRILTTPGHFAYLKIAEGCDNCCTYCTIPSLRGRYRSRSIESLVEEAGILADKGVKELILVAQDTALYGSDLPGEYHLPELLSRLADVTGIEWIRILYAYPEHITDELIAEMAGNEKICNYLDMPIQHGADTVLQRMGRESSRTALTEVIRKLREAMPDICLRTTLITGFPGETQAEFESLVSFIEDIGFDRLGVFAYSQEEDTPAAAMEGQIDEEIKLQRRDYLLELQKRISGEKLAKRVGQIMKVIVEGKLEGEDVYCGRSYLDCYEVDGLVFFDCDYELITGDFVEIYIEKASDYDLFGRLHITV